MTVASLENRAKEGTLVAEKTASVLTVLERCQALRIGKGLGSVLFVCGKRRKGKRRQGDVVRTFRGQQIPVVNTTKLVDEWNPCLAVVLEFFDL